LAVAGRRVHFDHSEVAMVSCDLGFGFPYTLKEVALAFQHMFAMFGACVLVPLLTGFSPAATLCAAGIGTICFHYITKRKIPVFLGSSFAFIPAVAQATSKYGDVGVQYAQFGVITAALLFGLIGALLYFVGPERITRLFPPVVTGSIIIVIGVGLTYSAINDVAALNDGPEGSTAHFYFTHQWVSWLIGLAVLAVILGVMIFTKGFLSMIPILIGMVSGYIVCLIARAAGVNVMDLSGIKNGPWLNVPYGRYYLPESMKAIGGIFQLPKVHGMTVLAITPLAIVTFMEHIGDITSIGSIVGLNYLEDPGLHRTLCADAVASALSGFLGGPEITTYSENVGVIVTTGNKEPRVIRLTCLFAIALGLIGKFGAVISAMPSPVKGACSVVLFGIIGAVGIRSLVEEKVDVTKQRNIVIIAVILSIGLGVNTATYAGGGVSGIPIKVGDETFGLSGLFIATLAGVVLNLVFPQDKVENGEEEKGEKGDEETRVDGELDELNEQVSVAEADP
jgi:uracil permease